MTDQTISEAIAAQIRSATDVALGRDGGRWTLTLRRRLPHSPDRVWRMLTEPELLARWSPVVPNRPLTTTGPATSRENPQDAPVDTEVLVADAPHLLVHRWGGHLLRWTVTPVDDGVLLELRHTFDERAGASSFAAGWRVCLGTLAATHDDVARERVVGPRARDYGWADFRDQYEAEFAGA